MGQNIQVIDGERRIYDIDDATGAQTLREIRDRDGRKMARTLEGKSMAEVETARPRQRKGD